MTCNVKHKDYFSDELYTWCTACGNYGIHSAIKRALVAECIAPKDILLCFDIGCNGNGSDKIGGYAVHGLHGRVLPLAAGASLANRRVKVLAFGGDGGTLSEGINHLVHSIRCDFDFTFILHNNRNYGLTTGQASCTTPADLAMNSSPDGITADAIEPMEFALNLNPSFAARAFSGNVPQMTQIVREAINHKGFSFVEILQDCPTYNKATDHDWYMQRVYDASVENHDRTNLELAKRIGIDMQNRIAVGVLYEDKNRQDFYSRQKNRVGVENELVDEVSQIDIGKLVAEFK